MNTIAKASNNAMIGTEDLDTDPILQWAIRSIGFMMTVAITLSFTYVARNFLEAAIPET